jgi:outer membrane protein OmpA-like peptidoglycan-associated protein
MTYKAFKSYMLGRSLTLVIGLLFSLPLHAQTHNEEPVSFGAFVHGGLNIHSANFQTLPGVPSCCPRFENGSGDGISIGAYYDLPFNSVFALELRLGYSSLNATLKTDEYTTVLVNGNAAVGEFEHSVATSIGMIGITPLARYQVLPRVTLLAGPELGWIISNNYSEQEMIMQPTNAGVFADNGERIRNAYSGSTPGASKFYCGITVGAQYRLPLNQSGSLFVLPEVLYTEGLTPLVSGMTWRANSVTAGIALQYTLVHEPVSPSTPPAVVEIPKPKLPALTASLRIALVDSETTRHTTKGFVIEDYIRTQYRPLLDFVFFGSGSSSLSSRYHTLSPTETEAFTYSQLNDLETLPLYYEMLNIIGKRMRDLPQGKLTIVGCNDDRAEKTNKTLSLSRALTVFNYLKDIWRIDSSRMKLEARNLPEQPSSVSDSDGAEENRRVEIYSNLHQITDPVSTTDTAHVAKPSVIRFLPNITSEAGITNWEIIASDEPKSTQLKDFSGKDSLPNHLDWNMEKESGAMLASLDTVHAILRVADRTSQRAESEDVTLPASHYTLADKHREGSSDTIMSRYSLILFDFDRGELSEANRRIADFVKARISKESKVSILGYTDRIGSDDYNRQLSELRVRRTQHYLGIEKADIHGLGRSALPYDNSLPEGRFYSRTVTVVVTTP